MKIQVLILLHFVLASMVTDFFSHKFRELSLLDVVSSVVAVESPPGRAQLELGSPCSFGVLHLS
jgi:hypothetical protein